jgi:putative hydrolase of HD superfamily
MNTEHQARRLLDLQALLIEFLDIERLIYLPDGAKKVRRETDTEHSFHLAMLGWYLCGSYPNLDKNKVIQYALAHDIVEIHAGDVMAVGRTEEQQTIKDRREAEALIKLKQDWPDFPDLTDTIETYGQQSDPESIFVKALDKLTPLVLNILSEGKTWKRFDIKRSDIIALKDEKTASSKEINDLWQVFKAEVLSHDEWFNPGKAL